MHAKLTYSIVTSLLMVLPFSIALAARYTPSPSHCSDSVKTCVSRGERVVGGFKVTKDCWEWSYIKTCTFPSKNDCSKYAHCYSLGQRNCLLRDAYGNCVNMQKEFSCKRWTPTYVESETVRYGEKDLNGQEGLICKGVPCIDGNCLDKSYDMDADMVQSVAQLAALSKGKNINNVTFKIFEGQNRHCSKKGMEYSNCCKVFPKCWGQKLGAKCSKEEQLLSDGRSKNLCISVGSEPIKSLSLTVGKKHFYCCFGNILEKTIQVEARQQLGLDFGSGGNPNCRGLNLDELAKVDFSKMDFSGIAAEMHKKIVMPNASDVGVRITNAIDRNNKFDHATSKDPANKTAGVNPKIRGE